MIHRIRGKSALVAAGVVATVVTLAWLFPPFHIVPLKGEREKQQAAVFDAEAEAARFWEAKLLPATMRATEVKDWLSALAKDTDAARSTTPFLVKGTGRVTSVEEDAVVVALDGIDAKVKLFTGLLFGNTVRDATGLLDESTYPNSQDFNDLSTQLNKIVETKIAPGLREKAVIGKSIRFAGCAELEEGAKPEGLPIVPVRIEWL